MSRGGRLEGEDLWDPQEMGAGDRQGCQSCAATHDLLFE